MSTYHVDGRVGVIASPGIWRVLDDMRRVVGYGTEAEDAARIARALAVLDAMDRLGPMGVPTCDSPQPIDWQCCHDCPERETCLGAGPRCMFSQVKKFMSQAGEG